jgi:hypothetical protein
VVGNRNWRRNEEKEEGKIIRYEAIGNRKVKKDEGIGRREEK